MTVYRRLADKMDQTPLGAPAGAELEAVLQALFDPDEAALAMALPFNPTPVRRLSEQLGRPADEVAAALEALADRGLVYARTIGRETYYALLPLFPGMFETQFMSGRTGAGQERLARLFDDFYKAGMGRNMSHGRTSYGRVIPVEKRIPVGMEIFDYERVSNFITDEHYYALAMCYCRHEQELLGRGCGKPKDVCMIFGPFAQFAVERGFAKKADEAAMRSALDRAEAAGLIHVSDNVGEQINFMCHCCGCCCAFLRSINELGRANVLAASRYAARLDPAACTGCLTCVETCQVKAAVETAEGVAIDAQRCLGCGACVNLCPGGALGLEPRSDYSPPFSSLNRLRRSLLDERNRQR